MGSCIALLRILAAQHAAALGTCSLTYHTCTRLPHVHQKQRLDCWTCLAGLVLLDLTMSAFNMKHLPLGAKISTIWWHRYSSLFCQSKTSPALRQHVDRLLHVVAILTLVELRFKLRCNLWFQGGQHSISRVTLRKRVLRGCWLRACGFCQPKRLFLALLI